jgi:1,2-phenylacetyl-CoA epoxidase PaaB subunit
MGDSGMSDLPETTPDGDVYEVFAKFSREEPLHHIGNVSAEDPDLAAVYAYTLYDEWGWREMIIVPRKEIVTLVPVA